MCRIFGIPPSTDRVANVTANDYCQSPWHRAWLPGRWLSVLSFITPFQFVLHFKKNRKKHATAATITAPPPIPAPTTMQHVTNFENFRSMLCSLILWSPEISTPEPPTPRCSSLTCCQYNMTTQRTPSRGHRTCETVLGSLAKTQVSSHLLSSV